MRETVQKKRTALFVLIAVLLVVSFLMPSSFSKDNSSAKIESSNSYRDEASPLKVTLEKVFKTDGELRRVAWSPDGKLLATADTLERRIIIWDYKTQTKLHTIIKSLFGAGPLIFIEGGKTIINVSSYPIFERKSDIIIDN